MTSMKGIEDLSFLDCLELASIANIDGTEVPFLHINQLGFYHTQLFKSLYL